MKIYRTSRRRRLRFLGADIFWALVALLIIIGAISGLIVKGLDIVRTVW